MIFVFDAEREICSRAIGSLKGGEGYFKRPTGIAVDSAAQRIYVTDTLRDKVFVLDMEGACCKPSATPAPGKANSTFPPSCAWMAAT